MTTDRALAGLLCALALYASSGPTAVQAQSKDTEDAIWRAFTRRVEAYADLHRCLEGPIPAVAVSDDPAEIQQAVRALGDLIRRARSDARRGDIFTPEATVLFRRSIRESCGGDCRKLVETIYEDEPNMPEVEVNGRWQADEYSFMPYDLLRRLPRLPDELHYRFVNRDLVLLDWHADLIVDVMPDALPAD